MSDLIKEIRDVKRWINDFEYKVRAVYIGGGTPTSLDTESLESILQECDFENEEFTVEAGRPDTITRDKLEIMKIHGVTRISVNPQSFNDKTLAAIGRNHSVEDILRVYREAKTYGFTINMDLIAMLPNEDLADFKYSVDKAIELGPHNITVHTLSLKRGSKLRESSYERDMSEEYLKDCTLMKIVSKDWQILKESTYILTESTQLLKINVNFSLRRGLIRFTIIKLCDNI